MQTCNCKITISYLFFYMLRSRCISGTVNSLEPNHSYKYGYTDCLLEICGPSIDRTYISSLFNSSCIPHDICFTWEWELE